MENASTNGHIANEEKRSHERQLSMVDSTVGDSVGVGAHILNQYRDRLPRRKGHRRKIAEGCGGLSCASWFFLFLSLLQLLAVSGIQITIVVMGRFTENRLPEYVQCLEDSLRNSPNIPQNFSIPDNSTFPRFGEDKQIYVYFFIALVLYNFFLCVYALTQQNITEVYAFMVLNILAMAYACLQVYQFRGFGNFCALITTVGYLAMANVFILLLFTIMFGLLSLTIYVEFGWKTYRLLNGNPAMRYYYRVYQVLMSLVKIVLFFLLMFTIGQCILILTPQNYEFSVTLVISAAILVLAYPIIYLVVTYEWRFGYFLIFVVVILLVFYCVFKIVRFSTLSCPLCMMRVKEVAMQLAAVRASTGLHDPIITDDDLSTLFSLNRVEDFGNLIMLGSLVLLFVVLAVVVFIHHLRFYNKGLKDYFDDQQPNIYLNKHCLKSCHRSASSYDVENSDGTDNKSRRLDLTAHRKNRKVQASQSSNARDSRLEETMTLDQPNFNEAFSSTKNPPKRFSSIEETYDVPEPNFNLVPPTVGVNWDNHM